MKIVKNDKFKLSIILLLILLSTTLMIIFKILNNIYIGNDEWKAKIGIVLESYVVDNWFVNLKNFFIG
ncbi:hypothetical protein [Mesoplasma melaleucae]|uniref:Uncharacterized protein n=1 Tax=Mesoplasma melaleucae TaxID=81459 RepID=A0A2K8NWH2_9MOLU|nr:hypothetical protein [Mesoplasma melaleucae]ATZ18117.1 hypothetical protein EMELA_v1c05950 [Mesoplasma melaleucae]